MATPRSKRSKSGARLITLLTDFGERDGYVASMKGVIAARAPDVAVVDICHAVPPQDLLYAGVVWGAALPYFPRPCVHVGVVDPGVGTERRILAAKAHGSVFLVPDNGLLGYVAERGAIEQVVDVQNQRYALDSVSSTFHGRDVFAPVAAHVALGLDLEELGPSVDDPELRSLPTPRRKERAAGRAEEVGEVLYIDTFGNVVTNLRPLADATLLRLEVGQFVGDQLRRTYGDVEIGDAVVLVGSMGYLEIAIRHGDAARQLKLTVGDRVQANWGPGSA